MTIDIQILNIYKFRQLSAGSQAEWSAAPGRALSIELCLAHSYTYYKQQKWLTEEKPENQMKMDQPPLTLCVSSLLILLSWFSNWINSFVITTFS